MCRLRNLLDDYHVFDLYDLFKKAKNIEKRIKNPPYFESLSLSTLQYRISLNNSHVDYIQKIKNRLDELTSRGGAAKVMAKQMVGLESYDINNSPKYIDKLGFQSEYLNTLNPTDYLLAKRKAAVLRRRSSASGIRTQRRIGVVGQMSNVSEMAHEARMQFHRDMHASQVDALLKYCSPSRDTEGNEKWVRKPNRYFENDDFDYIIRRINTEEAHLQLPDI